MSSAAIRGGSVAIEIGADAKKFYAALGAIQNKMRSFGASLSGIGLRVSALGAAASAPFAAAIRQSAGFQDTMSAVAAVTDATGEDFERLKKKALDLGASTSFTAQQVAEGMQALGQGGFTVEETLTGIEGTLLLARAGMLDLGTATSIAVAVLRSFKMPTSDAAKVADILAKAANSSNATVQGLGEALSTVGGIAYTAGTSLTELTAAIGLLADRGMQGSEAGTAMRRVLIGLAQEQDKLRDMGIEVKDPKTGKLKPLKVILADIRTAMDGMAETDKIAKLSKIFDVFGANAILQLMNAGDELDALTVKLDQAEGSAASAAKKMDDNLGGSFRMFASAVEGLGLSIGDALTPELRKWLGYLQGLAAGLSSAVQQNKEWAVAIAKSAIGAVAAGGALVGLGASFQVVAFSVGGFAKALAIATGPLGLVLKSASLITGAFASGSKTVAAIGALFTKAAIGVVAFAVSATAAAVQYAAATASMLAVTLARTAAIGAAWLGAAVAGTMAYIAHIKALVTYYTGALAGIVAITITRTGAMAGAWITQAGAAVATFVGTSVAGLATYIGSCAAAVAASVSGAAAVAAAWLAPIAPILGIGAAIAGIGIALSSTLSSSGSVASTLGAMFEPLSAGFSKVLADATKVFSDLWGIATETFGGISDAITAGDMSLAFEVLWAGLKAAWLRGQEGVMSYVDGFVEYIQNVWGNAVTWMAKAMVSANGMIERSWITMTDGLYLAFQTAINSVMNVWDTAVGAIQKAIAYIRSFFDESIDYDAVEKQINDANKRRKGERDKATKETRKRMDERLGRSRAEEEQAKQILDDENARAQRERAERSAEARGERAGATAAAGVELGATRRRAAGAREGVELQRAASGAESIKQLQDIAARARELADEGAITQDQLAAIEQAIDDQSLELDRQRAEASQDAEKAAQQAADQTIQQEGAKMETAGTFSAAAAVQMFAGTSLAERTAKATEETARNTRRQGAVQP